MPSGLPAECYPQSDIGEQRNWTLAFGDVRIQVLVDKKAFYIKKYAKGIVMQGSPTIPWKVKETIAEAWVHVKAVAMGTT